MQWRKVRWSCVYLLKGTNSSSNGTAVWQKQAMLGHVSQALCPTYFWTHLAQISGDTLLSGRHRLEFSLTYLTRVSMPAHLLKVSLNPAFHFTWKMWKTWALFCVDLSKVAKRENIWWRTYPKRKKTIANFFFASCPTWDNIEACFLGE